VLDVAMSLARENAGKDRSVIAAHKRLTYESALALCGSP
jgi:hypothetical protein